MALSGLPATVQAASWVALDCMGLSDTVVHYRYAKALEQITVDGLPAQDVTYLAGTFTFVTQSGGTRLVHQLNVSKALLRVENPETNERSELRRCSRVDDGLQPGPQPQ